MPENESILSKIKSEFELGEQELNSYSPLVLAYIGDGVYELIIRTILVSENNCPVHKLHKKATHFVKASAQAQMITVLLERLTEEEQEVYRRGRNAKSHTIPKNADMGDYRKATGFEAVIGYLFMKEDINRIMELVKEGLEQIWDTQK